MPVAQSLQLTAYEGSRRDRAAAIVTVAKTSGLLPQAQKIGRYLLDLMVEQTGIWHAFGVTDVPMRGRNKRLHGIGADSAALSNRFE